MSVAKFNLIGFYNYMESIHNPLFKSLNLPSGIDKNLFIETVLLKGGEFEPLYANPDFMQFAIGSWGKKHERTFQKWYDALQINYSPLENFDRFEEYTDLGNKSQTGSQSHVGSSSESKSDSLSGLHSEVLQDNRTEHNKGGAETSSNDVAYANGTTIGNNDTTNKVSAYDSGTLSDHDKSEVDSDSTTTSNNLSNTHEKSNSEQDTTASSNSVNQGSNSQESLGTSSQTDFASDGTKVNENNVNNHVGRLHGNIGVTTSQQMLQSELDIDAWNLYDHMSDMFVEELCLMVY